MTSHGPATEPQDAEERVARGETGIRILLALLFFLIARVAQTVLVAVIAFELLYTLVTERRPGSAVRQFANRTISYLVTVARYLTYHDDDLPFPFREFPRELDLERPLRPERPD